MKITQRARRIFDEKATKSVDGCWIWATPDRSTGYGRIGPEWAHRVSYELHVGPIPEGMQIDHLCRDRACVNPEHLEAVTQAENISRGNAPTIVAKREGLCVKAGHPLTVENRASNGRGSYTCRICKQERERARYRAQRTEGAA